MELDKNRWSCLWDSKQTTPQKFTRESRGVVGVAGVGGPAYVFFLYVQFFDYTKSVHRLAGFHLFYHVAQKLQYTNYGINFFLYMISGEKFRVDLINLFKCKKKEISKTLSQLCRKYNVINFSHPFGLRR